MNSKLGTILSIVLTLIVIALFSVSVLAAEPVSTEAATDSTANLTMRLAAVANEEAVREAARSIQSDSKLDLDIRLVGPTSVQLASQ
ncbi:MAG: hypothetical protein GXP15_17915 [Gammaproteobacteria bacterium]|nr:hypothetical protein [Gammaproteobacteria bacterium]